MFYGNLMVLNLVIAVGNSGTLSWVFWTLGRGIPIYPDSVNRIESVVSLAITGLSLWALIAWLKSQKLEAKS